MYVYMYMPSSTDTVYVNMYMCNVLQPLLTTVGQLKTGHVGTNNLSIVEVVLYLKVSKLSPMYAIRKFIIGASKSDF